MNLITSDHSINTIPPLKVEEWLRKSFPEVSVTLSHAIGQIGVLLRENSAILNESLKPLAADVIGNLNESFRKKGIVAPVFLTQNDGTLLRFTTLKYFHSPLSFT